MECAPTASAVVANVANPLPFTAIVASMVAPSLNVTLPVGIPEVADVTLAVNVTDWWYADGLREEVSVVVLPALLTVSVKTADVLPLMLPPPE